MHCFLCNTLLHFDVESQTNDSTNEANDSANLSLHLSFEKKMPPYPFQDLSLIATQKAYVRLYINCDLELSMYTR